MPQTQKHCAQPFHNNRNYTYATIDFDQWLHHPPIESSNKTDNECYGLPSVPLLLKHEIPRGRRHLLALLPYLLLGLLLVAALTHTMRHHDCSDCSLTATSIDENNELTNDPVITTAKEQIHTFVKPNEAKVETVKRQAISVSNSLPYHLIIGVFRTSERAQLFLESNESEGWMVIKDRNRYLISHSQHQSLKEANQQLQELSNNEQNIRHGWIWHNNNSVQH